MLTRRMVQHINERPRKVNRLPLAAIGVGTIVLAALVGALASSLVLAAGALAAGAVGVLLAYRAQKAKMVTTITYGDLRGDLKARFSAVQEGCEALSSSEAIWRLSGPPERRARKSRGDGAPPHAREPARVGLLETPGIRADVPIWGIEAGRYATVFFFPDAMLVYRDGRYEGFSYESLEVALASVRFYERDEVPEDARVVVRPKARSRMPVVLYGLVEIRLPRGVEVRLQVSSRDAAARFARAFGVEGIEEEPRKADGRQGRGSEAEEDAEKSAAYYDSLSMKEKARIASAFTTLGVRKGATMAEISAAYKKLARAHHPDKVAMLEPEEREVTERRMKEVNAAYTILKHLRRDLAGGAG
jgi:hypothetical protein